MALLFENELSELADRLGVRNSDYFLDVQSDNAVLLQVVHPGNLGDGTPPFGFAVCCVFDDEPEKHELFQQSRAFSSFTREDYQVTDLQGVELSLNEWE